MAAAIAMRREANANLGEFAPMDWQGVRGIPRYCAAVLDALKFTSVSPVPLRGWSDYDWQLALGFCDSSQLTLIAGDRAAAALPTWVAERIARNREANIRRLDLLWHEYREIARSLHNAAIEHVLLKGFTQAPWFVGDARLRPQYDLDLWCPADQVRQAQAAIHQLGFETIAAHRRFPTDHLPPMVRKTGWEWRGDYFDLEIPPVVELHFRLWDEATERFAAPGLEEFWARRQRQPSEFETIPVLHPADQFAFAALHVLRHLLRGNLRALHVYEIAYFLDTRQNDLRFWNEWRALYPAKLRELQTLACCLARRWFGCALPEAIAREAGLLPAEIRAWFASYAACAIESRFRVAKDELWLHLALLPSWSDRLAVTRRRLMPLTLPGRVDSAFVPEHQRSLGRRLRGALRHAAATAGRVLYHLRSCGPVLRGAVHWWRVQRSLRGHAG